MKITTLKNAMVNHKKTNHELTSGHQFRFRTSFVFYYNQFQFCMLLFYAFGLMSAPSSSVLLWHMNFQCFDWRNWDANYFVFIIRIQNAANIAYISNNRPILRQLDKFSLKLYLLYVENEQNFKNTAVLYKKLTQKLQLWLYRLDYTSQSFNKKKKIMRKSIETMFILIGSKFILECCKFLMNQGFISYFSHIQRQEVLCMHLIKIEYSGKKCFFFINFIRKIFLN